MYEDDFRVTNFRRYQKRDINTTIRNMTPTQKENVIFAINTAIFKGEHANKSTLTHILKELRKGLATTEQEQLSSSHKT